MNVWKPRPSRAMGSSGALASRLPKYVFSKAAMVSSSFLADSGLTLYQHRILGQKKERYLPQKHTGNKNTTSSSIYSRFQTTVSQFNKDNNNAAHKFSARARRETHLTRASIFCWRWAAISSACRNGGAGASDVLRASETVTDGCKERTRMSTQSTQNLHNLHHVNTS